MGKSAPRAGPDKNIDDRLALGWHWQLYSDARAFPTHHNPQALSFFIGHGYLD
jgi:hypothetical protein